MFDPRSLKQAKANVALPPKGSRSKLAMMPDAVQPEDKIRVRAYELFESRGREPGQEQQDWLLAEQEILKPQR